MDATKVQISASNSFVWLYERNVDPLDLRILEILQANARETQADIARDVGLAPSAVLERIRKLEAEGSSAATAPWSIRERSRCRCWHSSPCAATRSERTITSRRRLPESPEVLEVHHVAGDDCYLIKVRARDAEHLGLLLRTRFGRIPGVRSTRTTIVLETVKETPRLPIARAQEVSS